MEILDIIKIIGPILGVLAWMYNRIDKRFDSVDKKFDSIMTELKEIRTDIRALDNRISHIEGYIMGRDMLRTGTDKTVSSFISPIE